MAMRSSDGKPGVYLVLTISIVALILPLLFIESDVLEHTHGIFAYPLDDPYIHLAVAKNLARYDVWGISQFEFASASSSILYPLVLSGIFKIIGVHITVPFFVNLIVAIIFLIVVRRWVARQGIGLMGQLIILLIAIFLIPLPLLVMCGMEHTLHLLFCFLFLTSFCDALQDMLASPAAKPTFHWKIYVYGALMTAIRYESMSLILLSCGILLYNRRWLTAAKLGVIGFLPILAFGAYSLSKGGFFLPNSVVLKSAVPPFTPEGILGYLDEAFIPRFFSADAGYNEMGAQRLLLLLPLTYLLFFKATEKRISYRFLLLMLMACTVFQLAFMIYSAFPRYEAYFVGCSVVVCATLFAKYTPKEAINTRSATTWISCLFGAVILTPLFLRAWHGFARAPLAAISIFDQQYQMGLFVHDYYDNDPIAFNDIGAVSWLSRGNKLDLWGLGDNIAARARQNHYNSPQFMDSLSHKKQVKIAIVFEYPFRPLLKRWQKVASWYIPFNNAAADDSVSFYAVNPAEAPRLISNLKSFQPSLPRGVIVKYY